MGPHPADRGAHPHCRHPRVAPQRPRRRHAPVRSDLEHTASWVPHAQDRIQETRLSADTMSIQTPRRATASRSTGLSRASRPFHADREAAPLWMRAVGAALLGAGTALSAAVLAWPGDAPEVALLVPGLVAVTVGLLLLLARAGFTVTERHVTLHFRPLPPRRIHAAGSPGTSGRGRRDHLRRHRPADRPRGARAPADTGSRHRAHRRPGPDHVRPDASSGGRVPCAGRSDRSAGRLGARRARTPRLSGWSSPEPRRDGDRGNAGAGDVLVLIHGPGDLGQARTGQHV